MNIERIINKKIEESNLSIDKKEKALNDSITIVKELVKRQKILNLYLIEKIVQRRIEYFENIA